MFLLAIVFSVKASIAFTEPAASVAVHERTMMTPKILQPISEREILEKFFRTFLSESQGGYVLYGSKPICTEGILPQETNLLILGDDLHKRNVIFKQGLKVWEKSPRKNRKYLIHFYEKPSYGWQQIALINREAFLTTVERNLPLFQYILGPKVSPEGLFEKLINPEESFSSVFLDNKVLIGIVLGFGTQNALYASREENLIDSLSQKERIPFKSLNSSTPSFDYFSLDEELDYLNQSLYISKDLITKSDPYIPWFSCLKNKQTKMLIKSYSNTQGKVSQVLKSKRFIREILNKFGIQLNQLNFSMLQSNTGYNWPSLIANAITQGMLEHDQEWIDSFVEGMKAYEQTATVLPADQWYQLLDSYRVSETAVKRKENLNQCEAMFSQLSKRRDLISLVPGKLYYKVTQQGCNKTQEIPSSVRIDYMIKNHLGKVLCAQSSEEVDLSKVICGLSIAIKEMAIGEEREIYIHPSLAYGESSNFPPNIGLISTVKLKEIITQEKEPSLSFISLELSAANMDESQLQKEYHQRRCQVAFHLGEKTWAHFKKGQDVGYCLDLVLENLLNKNKHSVSLTPEMNEALAELHWRIYRFSN